MPGINIYQHYNALMVVELATPVKSVRQNKIPSFLYCPNACEKDMVNLSMMNDEASEIIDMKMIF